MGGNKEIESRFKLDTDLEARLLKLTVFEGFVAGPVYRIDLIDTYVDTPQRDLRKKGALLRLRDERVPKDDKYVQKFTVGFKICTSYEGATATIDEYEEPFQQELATAFYSNALGMDVGPCQRARQLIEDVYDGRGNISLLVSNRRLVRHFIPYTGEGIVELAFDALVYNGREGKQFSEMELEIEAKRGIHVVTFARFVMELQKAFSLEPSTGNKYERGLLHVDGQ